MHAVCRVRVQGTGRARRVMLVSSEKLKYRVGRRVQSLMERWRAHMELPYACSLEVSTVRDGKRKDV